LIYNTSEGQTFTAVQEFLDEDDLPVSNKPGYPRVRLYDQDKSVILEQIAQFVSPGRYTLDVAVPKLNLEKKSQLTLVWVLRDSDDHKYKVTDVIIVEPLGSKRVTDIFTINSVDVEASFVLPHSLVASDGKFSVYYQNNLVHASLDLGTVESNGIDSTTVSFVLPTLSAKLDNYLVLASVKPNGSSRALNYTYKLWSTTPSVLTQISLIEDFVNKSRLQNVIPELEYTHSDIMSALLQGLSHFNGIGPQLTSFNGLNMQGPIGNAWFICSCWYLINAQKMAEGNVAFDFSGQGVSLNVDRTPFLDALLGSIESRIQDTVVPLKKLLGKAGITSGDGSQGSNLQGAANSRAAASKMGMLTVTNSPTTRFVSGQRWQQQ
jgi:hypothetical protein